MSNFYEHGRAAMTSCNEDWETPQRLFEQLDERFRFTLDPCSTHDNAKCDRHYTKEEDGLAQSWAGESVFCNPPYGRGMAAWVRKCAEESRHANVSLLVPARTDTRWFWSYVAPYARVEFIQGRLRYELGGVPLNSSPFPSMLCIYGERPNIARYDYDRR